MIRVKRGFVARKRRKKVLSLASGFYGSRSKLFRTANQAVNKGLYNSYISRRLKKRNFRKLWIVRIGAAAKANGLKYSNFIYKLKSKKISLNRKILSQIAIIDPASFKTIINQVR